MVTAVPGQRSSAVLSRSYKIAWGLALVFYFLEYAVRSSPAVMIPELSTAFRTDAVGLSGIIGSYYYTYSVTSLLAGVVLDRFGAKTSVPVGIAVLGIGCLLFVLPTTISGEGGRLLQGAGSAFAFTGAVYLAAHGFAAGALATAIGFTQCFGMLGGSAGQFAVGPLIQRHFDWRIFWVAVGLCCFAIGVVLFLVTPAETRRSGGTSQWYEPFAVVFKNPQSYLCGIVAGLLFAPTTVGDMIWGVALFQQDKHLGYQQAVFVASTAPLGWVFGCPLLGWLADRFGRRKPVLIFGAALMLATIMQISFFPDLISIYAGMFLMGVGSGAAMIPYTIIKEANPDRVKGSATGVINFITFGVTALIGPVYAQMIGKSLSSTADHAEHFRHGGVFWAAAVALAIALSFFLRETGRGAERRPSAARADGLGNAAERI